MFDTPSVSSPLRNPPPLATPPLSADTLAVSIVIPVYNEIGALAETVRQVGRYMDETNILYEIILVDDGSTDGSREIIEQIDQLRVRKVHHEVNRGYGAALKTGLKHARFDLMAITDADGTYPNERLPELIYALGEGDMVVGARTGQNVHIPTARKPAKWVLNELANGLSGSKIPDLNSGLRVMRKETVKRFLYILPNSFSFTTTITLAMLSDGRNVRYIPVDYFHRSGSSKISPIKDTVRFTQLVIRTVMYFNPLRVFIPLSLVLFLSSLMVLVYRLFTGGGLLVFGIVLFVSAIQVLTTGMLADLIDKSNARYSEVSYNEATYSEVQG